MLETMSLNTLIVIITAAVSLIANNNVILKRRLLFNAYDIKHGNEWYRWITHGFVHGSFFHLAINMWVLFMFGSAVEELIEDKFEFTGKLYYLTLYLVGIVVSSASAFIKHQDNPGYNSLGASGAVASVMFVFILFYPTKLLYIFGVVPMPAFLLGILYLWYEYSSSKRAQGRIAHDAHFWGAIFGVIFTLAVFPGQFSIFCEKVLVYVQNYLP